MSANGSQVNGSLFWVGGPNSFGVREIFLIEVYMIKILPASGELHSSGIAEVMGSNPVVASEFFLDFICNCLS